MLIRWSPEAANDLARIIDRIKFDNPAAARRVAETIYRRCTDLNVFPNRGRVGWIAGTRELVLAPLPYIVVYRIAPTRSKSCASTTARSIGLRSPYSMTMRGGGRISLSPETFSQTRAAIWRKIPA